MIFFTESFYVPSLLFSAHVIASTQNLGMTNGKGASRSLGNNHKNVDTVARIVLTCSVLPMSKIERIGGRGVGAGEGGVDGIA